MGASFGAIALIVFFGFSSEAFEHPRPLRKCTQELNIKIDYPNQAIGKEHRFFTDQNAQRMAECIQRDYVENPPSCSADVPYMRVFAECVETSPENVSEEQMNGRCLLLAHELHVAFKKIAASSCECEPPRRPASVIRRGQK